MEADRGKAGLAVVTGAAGGMGSATAARLAAAGHALLLCDSDATRLADLAATLPAGTPAELLAGDISDAGWTARLLAQIGDRAIAALVHTAGLSPTMGDAERMFAVNYDATVRLVDAVRARMAPGACAVLITSSSGYLMKSPEIDALLDAMVPGELPAGLRAIATDSGRAYALSKRAVIRLIAREAMAFGAHGARIAGISPGLIDTAMGRAEAKGSEQMAGMLARTPLARYGVADEIATVAVFLCSPGAAYVSGCDIPVDGGTLATLGAL